MYINSAYSNTTYKPQYSNKKANSGNEFSSLFDKKKNNADVTQQTTASQESSAQSSAPKVCQTSLSALIEAQSKPIERSLLPEGLVLFPHEKFIMLHGDDKLREEYLKHKNQLAISKAHYKAYAAAEAAKKNIQAANTSLKWYEGRFISLDELQARTSGTIQITLGKDELPKLMEEIEKSLANGECYTVAILKLYNSHNHARGQRSYETFFVDPYTGEVKHASPLYNTMSGEGELMYSSQDDDAVWDLAYDLQQFLKLRVFGETAGMSEDEVEQAITDIKERQTNKCTWRFDVFPPTSAAKLIDI